MHKIISVMTATTTIETEATTATAGTATTTATAGTAATTTTAETATARTVLTETPATAQHGRRGARRRRTNRRRSVPCSAPAHRPHPSPCCRSAADAACGKRGVIHAHRSLAREVIERDHDLIAHSLIHGAVVINKAR